MTFSCSISLAVVALLGPGAGGSFAAGPAAAKAPPLPAEDLIVRDLCARSVAMLGESPSHGFGRTLQLKVSLVRRLIDQCHYNAFFIESGTYDFLNIDKRLQTGREVTESMLAAAIGGLWATRELQPLISFLLEKVKAGNVTLGGLDDQLARGTYAQREMPSDLVQYLAPDEKPRCLAILQKHTLWQYTQASPYSPPDKALIIGCLAKIEAAVRKAPFGKAPFREYDLAMIGNFQATLARDFRQDLPKGFDQGVQDGNERDRSMYRNFEWLLRRLPAHSKVIVWAANTHVAKDLGGISGEEGVVPFGSYVRRAFKSRAFALGFSAYSGSYARTGQPARQLTAAPRDSLEAQSFAGAGFDTVYWSSRELRKLGSLPARPLGSDWKTARWNQVVDGILVFREERPPEFLR